MHTGILFVSATRFEVSPLLEGAEELSGNLYKTERYYLLIGGVGMMHMSFALTQALWQLKDVRQVIHLGIAGDYLNQQALGTLFHISSASYGDLGTLKAEKFSSFYDDGLLNPNTHPFEGGIIKNPSPIDNKLITSLPKAHCVTLNLLSSREDIISQRRAKAALLADEAHLLEHMECLAVFYVCRQLGKHFTTLLATSNRVGEEDKAKWEFKKAIKKLNDTARELVSSVES